ncbi:MAG: hypothetical protein KKF00_05795 [Proteobacteria bacterium]|nr:hypothetical protein [Pseudomonadota bacterium]
MSSAVKQEFFRWIGGLGSAKLTDTERKLLNLMVTHFDTLAPLTTVKGSNPPVLPIFCCATTI